MAKKEIIRSARVFPSNNPLSPAIRVGDLLFLSGQIGRDPKTGQVADDFALQARQTFENMKMLLEDAGSSMDNLVKVTVLLKRAEDLAAMNEIYREYINRDYPARSSYTAGLYGNILIEIEVVASV